MATNKDFIVKNGLDVGGDANFVAGGKAIFGTGGDSSQLQIYSSGTHSFIEDRGVGNLYIDGSSSVVIRGDTANVISAIFNDNGSVVLKHAGANTLVTSATGVDITGNAVLTGELRGPASFVIDPAAHGDDTGTVIIAGNLQVDGLTTTINSTTLTVDDKNIVLASGAPNAAAADGAGIQVDITGVTNPEWNWYVNSVNTGVSAWESNYPIVITQSDASRTTNLHLVNETSGAGTEVALQMSVVSPANDACDVRLVAHRSGASAGSDFYIETTNGSNAIERRFTIAEDGNVGIGTVPNSWDTTITALEIDNTSISTFSDSVMLLSANTYFDDTANAYKYIGDGFAAQIVVNSSGTMQIKTAPSGTATNATTLTERFLLNQDGSIVQTTTNAQSYNAYNALTNPSMTIKNLTSGASKFASLGFITEANGEGAISLVQGSGNINADMTFSLRSSGSRTEHLRITHDGNVGIGTDAPSYPLQVSESGASTTNTVANLLALDHYPSTTPAANGFGVGIVLRGKNPGNGSSIYGSIEGQFHTISSTYQGGALVFKTDGYNGGNTERLRIDSIGNVGIGTDSPTKKLTVFGTGAGNATVQIEGEGGADPYINFLANNTQHWSLGIDDSDADKFKLSEHSALGTNDYFVVDVTGKVGIGTTAPQDTLHVVTDSATTNDTVDVVTIEATSSGTPAVGFGPTIEFRAERGTATPDSVGRLGFVADGMTNTTVNGAFIVETAVDGTFTESLRIGSDGNIGVGTNGSPNSYVDETTLTINGTAFGRLDLEAGGTLRSSLFSGSTYTALTVGTSRIQVESSSDIKFNTQNDTKLIVKNAGNVGIGTDAPVQTLDVDGSIGTRQVRHSIRPSLNLDFANSKELDSSITFYRDSVATYYDSKGTLKYANINEPRFDHDPLTGESKGLLIEEARTNIATASTLELPLDFNGMYTDKFREVAPDGTYSGHHILASSGVSRHEVNIKYAGTATVVYTASTYIKPLGAVTWVSFSRAGGSDMIGFDLINITTNTPGGTASGTISDAGNGWRKIIFTFTETSTGSSRSVYMSPGIGTPSGSVYYNLNGDGENGVAIWGSQIEVGTFATSYIPPDTSFTSRASSATYHDETGILRTAPAQIPRYGYKYDGRKWVETGLILEAASTNMLYHSTKGSDLYGDVLAAEAIWTITDSSTDVSAPDGGKFTTKGVSGTSGNSWYWQTSPLSYTNGTTYTHSAWVRTAAGTTGTIVMNVYPQTGAISVTATDEWQRVSVTFVYNSSMANPYIGFVSPQLSRTFYFWGWQIEAQTQPTSYISTLGSAVTRAADVVSSVAYTRGQDVAKINNITNEDWYNTKEGSIYVDFDPSSGSGSDAIVLGVGDGTIRGFRAPWLTGATQIRAASWSGTAYSALQYYNSITTTDQHKLGISFSYQDATFTSSLDGSTAQQATSWAGVETDATTIWIGGETDTGRRYTGTIAKVSIYNEALAGAELQALTENN